MKTRSRAQFRGSAEFAGIYLVFCVALSACSAIFSESEKGSPVSTTPGTLDPTPPITATTIYLRSSGVDVDAIVGDSEHPFLTAQAAVEAALSANPSLSNPVIIDVGSGNFGDITLHQNFGEHVTWRGVDSTVSVIGNIVAKGSDGAHGSDPLDGSSTNGQDGSHGFNVILSATSPIRFGQIDTSGGQGGNAFVGNPSDRPTSGNGGNAGTIFIGENVFTSHLLSNGAYGGYPVNGVDMEYPGSGGGNGAEVVVNGECASISAVGGQGQFMGGGGNGGTVFVGGVSSGNVSVRGGDGVDRGTPGTAGTVTVDGRTGDVMANGAASSLYPGSQGGSVTVNGEAGKIYASGGDSSYMANGGSILVNTGAIVSDLVAADGGIHGGCIFGAGGTGGTVTIYRPATYTLNIVTDSECGSGGQLILH
jgi:hypothetical protein